MAIEIKSSLLNDSAFRNVKKSLISVSAIDNKADFRIKAIEYINDSSENNDDMFFYDMLPYTRFLDPKSEDMAYTTPEGLIFLNCPGKIGEKLREWDFTYDHECLHQLWETFSVEKEIIKKHGDCNHLLLNIASDCVINDYLSKVRKKSQPENTITPQYIQDKFGIKYDRKVDTQYTLYVKLLPKAKELEKDPICQTTFDGKIDPKKVEKVDGGNNGPGPDPGTNGNVEKHSEDYIKGWTDAIQDVLDKKADPTDKSYKPKSTNNEEYDNGYNDCMEDIKNGMENGVGLVTGGGGNTGNSDLPAIPWNTDSDDQTNSPNTPEDPEDDKEGKSGGSQGNNAATDNEQHNEDLEAIKKETKDIIEKYKSKISGVFGEFISKCKSSVKCNVSGLAVKTSGKGNSSWNQNLFTFANSYIKKKIFQKHREWESTYRRIKRGSGVIKFGEPIAPGKQIKDNKLDISIAYYVDRSGSMSGCINDVWKALYAIADAMTKKFGKDKVVSRVKYDIYAFDTKMHELQYGKKMSADGGTMNFDEILNFIHKNTKDNLINIILTDAGFSINTNEVKNLMKELDGLFIFITNQGSQEMENLSKQYPTQLKYILADSAFTVDK